MSDNQSLKPQNTQSSANAQASQVDPQLVQILDVLSKFGFKFFGYSESKEPLVIAQNGQVVTVTVAYNFAQTQMAKASAAASLGSIENMPQMPQALNMPTSPESKMEAAAEKPSDNIQNFTLEDLPKITKPAPQSAPQVQQSGNSPFGDGFKITSIDPSNVGQAMAYVKKHSKLKQTSTKKYLALQFEKFLNEIKAANKKK